MYSETTVSSIAQHNDLESMQMPIEKGWRLSSTLTSQLQEVSGIGQDGILPTAREGHETFQYHLLACEYDLAPQKAVRFVIKVTVPARLNIIPAQRPCILHAAKMSS